MGGMIDYQFSLAIWLRCVCLPLVFYIFASLPCGLVFLKIVLVSFSFLQLR